MVFQHITSIQLENNTTWTNRSSYQILQSNLFFSFIHTFIIILFLWLTHHQLVYWWQLPSSTLNMLSYYYHCKCDIFYFVPFYMLFVFYLIVMVWLLLVYWWRLPPNNIYQSSCDSLLPKIVSYLNFLILVMLLYFGAACWIILDRSDQFVEIIWVLLWYFFQPVIFITQIFREILSHWGCASKYLLCYFIIFRKNQFGQLF